MRSERLGDLFNITQIKKESPPGLNSGYATLHIKVQELGEGRARESQESRSLEGAESLCSFA